MEHYYKDMLENMTVEELHSLLAQCFSPEEYTQLLADTPEQQRLAALNYLLSISEDTGKEEDFSRLRS